jgi:hypothetical protein
MIYISIIIEAAGVSWSGSLSICAGLKMVNLKKESKTKQKMVEKHA